MKLKRLLGVAVLSAALSGCTTEPLNNCPSPRVAIPSLAGDTLSTGTGLRYIVRTAGTGEVAQASDSVGVHYTGYLADGTRFDSTAGRNPAEFRLEDLIPGFSQGIVGMRVGGSRRLIIPPALGYGAIGAEPCIPGNATLIFDVDLTAVYR